MGGTMGFVIELVIAMLVVLIVYNTLKRYVFYKFKPIKGLKWIMVGVALLLCIFDSFIGAKFKTTSWQYMAGMVVFMVSLLATYDLFGWANPSKYRNTKDDLVIKSKAKPNRAKKTEEK